MDPIIEKGDRVFSPLYGYGIVAYINYIGDTSNLNCVRTYDVYFDNYPILPPNALRKYTNVPSIDLIKVR
jgi:signal peptidase I